MEQTFKIPNISCGHCTMAIKNELTEMEGISEVNGSPEQKTVTVKWDTPATASAILEKLKEINYPAAD